MVTKIPGPPSSPTTVAKTGVKETRSVETRAVPAAAPVRPRIPLLRRIPAPGQRLADVLVVVVMCLLAGLERPVLTSLGIILVLTVTPRFYRSRLVVSVLDALPRTFVAGAVAAYVVSSLTNPGLGVLPLLGFSLATAGGIAVSRIVLGQLTRARRRRNPAVLSRTLILGSCAAGRRLCRDLQAAPEFGLLPVALVDRAIKPGPDTPGVAVEQLNADLPALIRRHRATTVIVAFTAYSDEELVKALRACLREDAELYLVPRLREYHTADSATEMVGAVPLRHLSRAAHRSPLWFLKRPIDIVVSGLALVALSPLLALLALLVKLDDRSAPILFRQVRVGLDGRPFEMLKFRSMTPANSTDAHRNWSIAGDSRITPLGKTMRKFSLDELPQIYNVFRGDMTLVGPRPERVYFVEQLGRELPDYLDRHRVPVGLTGWAAINGLRGDTSIPDRVLYDNYYIENWSPWLDIKIIVLTFRAMFTGSGE